MTGIVRLLCLLALAGSAPKAWAQADLAGAQATVLASAAPRDASLPSPLASPLAAPVLPPDTLNGTEIYRQFRDGLADQDCQPQATDAHWQRAFSRAPARLADREDDILPLFGYVVGAMRDAGLPTEFALIPFVESGYHPAASSGAGPTGLWQFVSLTARNHGVRVRSGYDGRLSPVDSTQAAVRYLKTLHGMFGGDWRLAVMAYNAGENRMLQAVRRTGAGMASAHPSRLPGLSRTTYTYVQKLHALACSLEQAGDRPDWLAGLDRPVPRLQPRQLPSDFGSLAGWAQRQGHDAGQLAGLNPGLTRLRATPSGGPLWVLAPAAEGSAIAITAADLVAANDPGSPLAAMAGDQDRDDDAATSYTVVRGDTLSSIAKRHGLRTVHLQQWNRMGKGSVIKPGMVLRLAEPVR
jgi:membrane-bound lytic murein transglycosylase D